MKMKQTLLFILSAIIVITTACDIDGKNAAERGYMQQQNNDSKQQNNTIKQQTDIVVGNIGSKVTDTSLVSYTFKNKTHAIKFNKKTNVCQIPTLHNGIEQPLSIGYENPVAEYTIKDAGITLNFKEFSKVMANRTVEWYEQYLRERLARMPNKPAHAEEEIKQMMEEVKKGNIIEKVNKLYTEYLKEPPLEGVLSADKKTITFKKFVIPGYNKIERYENVTFTRQ